MTRGDVEQDLCDTLAALEKAEAKGKTRDHDKKLEDYRERLDEQTGKAVSAAAAAQLKSLLRYL